MAYGAGVMCPVYAAGSVAKSLMTRHRLSICRIAEIRKGEFLHHKINCNPAGLPAWTDIANRHSISSRLCLRAMAAKFKK